MNDDEIKMLKRIDRQIERTNRSLETIVDTAANVTYSLLVGTILDAFSGQSIPGILGSRIAATATNTATGGLYGKWRNALYQVTKTGTESSSWQKTRAELYAFNTFQVPVYFAAAAVGSFISEGEVNVEKASRGALYLAAISPLIGPTMGLFMDYVRSVTGEVIGTGLSRASEKYINYERDQHGK